MREILRIVREEEEAKEQEIMFNKQKKVLDLIYKQFI
jgi:hypothetical protein